MKRIAILTPGFLPVPSVKGGAIEEIITKVINKNEVESKYKIDLFTKADSDIDKIKLKNTGLYMAHVVNIFNLIVGFTLFNIFNSFNIIKKEFIILNELKIYIEMV